MRNSLFCQYFLLFICEFLLFDSKQNLNSVSWCVLINLFAVELWLDIFIFENTTHELNFYSFNRSARWARISAYNRCVFYYSIDDIIIESSAFRQMCDQCFLRKSVGCESTTDFSVIVPSTTEKIRQFISLLQMKLSLKILLFSIRWLSPNLFRKALCAARW